MKCLWAAAAPNCGTGRLVWVWVAPRAGPYPAEGAQGCPMWDRFYSRHKRRVSSCLDISWCHLEPIDAQFQPTWRSSQAALIHSDSEIIHTSALLQHCDIFFSHCHWLQNMFISHCTYDQPGPSTRFVFGTMCELKGFIYSSLGSVLKTWSPAWLISESFTPSNQIRAFNLLMSLYWETLFEIRRSERWFPPPPSHPSTIFYVGQKYEISMVV